MQMMIDPQAPEYKPRHMRPVAIEVQGLEGLRKLVEQLPDGTVYSIDLEVISDGQEKK
jgi:hypothetical protein